MHAHGLLGFGLIAYQLLNRIGFFAHRAARLIVELFANAVAIYFSAGRLVDEATLGPIGDLQRCIGQHNQAGQIGALRCERPRALLRGRQ